MRRTITLLALASCVGCTSVSSSVLTRDAYNENWACHEKIRGMPVTLKVPTHMRVDIVELDFFGLEKGNRIGRLGLTDRPLYKVNHSIVRTDKVFFVDMDRPAAGTITSTIDMNPETQYPETWTYTAEDETLLQSAKLLKAIAPGLLSPAGTPASQVNAFKDGGNGVDIHLVVRQVENVVASRTFELDSPGFEAEVRGFINSYLNCNRDCETQSPKSGARLPVPAKPSPAKRPPVAPAVEAIDTVFGRPAGGDVPVGNIQ